jgi:hypothetical protein
MTTEGEQTTQQETPAPAEVDEREALVAAVKAAKSPEAKGDRERDESGKFKPKPKADPKPAPDPAEDAEDEPPPPAAAKEEPAEDESTLPALARSIRQREREQAKRDELAAERAAAEREKAEAAAERAAAKAEREAAAKERAEAQAHAAKLQRILADPRAAAKEIGWDEEKLSAFAAAAVEEGKPETVAMRKLMERDAAREKELAEIRAWRDEQTKAEQARAEQQRQAAEAAEVQSIHRELLSQVSTEKTPHIIAELEDIGRRLEWTPEELRDQFISRCYRIAADYKKRTGQVAQIPEIVEYLEYGAAERRGAPAQQASAETGQPAKAKGNGQRSLSAAAASERRASPKPIQDMDPDEEKDFLVKLIQDAR